MAAPIPLTPADELELRDILAAASGERRPIEIIGGGSKADIGRPQRLTQKVSLAKLTGVIDYDPAELVLTVRAGEPLSAIEALLAESNQMLAFEPFDFDVSFGRSAGASTMGGMVAAGLAGSRRLSAGNVRDHVLGFSALSGAGEAFKAGGRVVKNVTGYDVSKLMAGSWGRLAVMTEMTLKVLPRPRVTLTLALRGLSMAQGGQAMARALRSQAEPAAAAYVPGEPSLTGLRLEGSAPSIAARARLLADLLSDLGRIEPLEGSQAQAFWAGVRGGAQLCQKSDGASGEDALWRISLPLSAGARVGEGLAGGGCRLLLDWAGGLIWALTPASAIASVREIAEAAGGHAMMVRAPASLRQSIPALHPEAPGVAALAARVKAAFDPSGILDPERFFEAAP